MNRQDLKNGIYFYQLTIAINIYKADTPNGFSDVGKNVAPGVIESVALLDIDYVVI